MGGGRKRSEKKNRKAGCNPMSRGYCFSLPPMTEKAFPRRSFMKGLVASGLLEWLYDSDSFSARVIRGVCEDSEREVVRIAAADLSSWSDGSVDVCWVGHATVFVNFF